MIKKHFWTRLRQTSKKQILFDGRNTKDVLFSLSTVDELIDKSINGIRNNFHEESSHILCLFAFFNDSKRFLEWK